MKKISIGLIFIVILIHSISAQDNISDNILAQETGISTINYINIEVSDNGFAIVEEEIVVNNTIASILVPLHVDILSISDAKNRLKYELSSKNGMQLLAFYLISPMDRTVKIKYSTQHLTSKNGGVWALKFLALATPYHTIVNIKFPTDSDIISLTPDIPRYPANLSNPIWLYPQTKEFYFEMDYRTTQKLPPLDTADSYIYLTILLVLSLIVILAVIFIKNKSKKELVINDKKSFAAEAQSGGKIFVPKNKFEPSDSGITSVEKKDDIAILEEKDENYAHKLKNNRKIKDSVIKMLDENEKKILEMLESSEDEITQAYVYKTIGIPKSSLSDIMQRLEKRNIIERRKDGRISWIKLKDWVLD